MRSFYSRWGKRAIDVAAAAALLAGLSPLMAAVAAAIVATEGRPIFFRQRRPGLGERPFVLLKFRTMRDARDASGEPLPDEARLTRLGAFLRRTSLDELPELLNVLAGSMSLVGPRPLLERYGPWFRPGERRRFEVRPGITGLAQVRGRNAASWDERLALDVRYVEELSLATDLRTLLETVRVVLFAQGVEVLPATRMLDLDAERRGGRGAGPGGGAAVPASAEARP